MKGFRQRWIVRATCALALLGSIDAVAVQPQLARITFLTNYVFQGRHAPFFLGRDKGFYRDAGFELNIVPATGSGFVISALDSGKADYGMAESASVIQAVARGARVKGFSVFMDVSTSGLASLQPLQTPQSVADKPIAASLTDSARVILPVVFARARLDVGRINWVTSDPGVYFSLLLGGRVELITASSDGDVPALRRVAGSRKQTVHFASFADWGYDVFGYFLVARADRLASGDARAQARAFVAATARAVQYSIEHPDEAAQSVSRGAPALPEATALAQSKESLRAIQTDFVRQHGYGQATEARLGHTIALVSEALSLNPAPAPTHVYVESFLKQ
jgi:NitT/TauT family transport system substrate-binding protein